MPKYRIIVQETKSYFIEADNEELAKEAGKFANTIFHPVSTCRMGNDEMAVVNDKLVAHGLSLIHI